MANDPSPQAPTPLPFRQVLKPALPTGPDNVKDYLIARGWTEDRAERQAQRVAAQMVAVPQDWTGMISLGLKTAIPFLVARYIPGGGGLLQTGKQILTNIGGQAAIGGVEQAVRTGQPSQGLGGVVQSGLQAAPGAGLQGALGMALLPRKATVQAQRAITDFKRGLSPEVGKVLDPAQPKETLFSASTLDRMQRIAGQKLDAMEAAVQKELGKTTFDIPLPGIKPASAPPLFGPSGARITDPALRKLIQGAQPGSQVLEGSTFQEVRDRVKTLRTGAYETEHAKIAAKREANQLEERLLADMTQKGFGNLAAQYRQVLLTHAKDMVGVRGIKWVQTQQRRPGGASPVDDPELSRAMDHLVSKGRGQEARLMLAGVFAAMRHPFLAAGEAIQAAKQAGKVVDVNRIRGPLTPTPLRQAVPPLAGATTTGLLGSRTLGSESPSVNPAVDELTQMEQEIGASDVQVGELDRLIKALP